MLIKSLQMYIVFVRLFIPYVIWLKLVCNAEETVLFDVFGECKLSLAYINTFGNAKRPKCPEPENDCRKET